MKAPGAERDPAQEQERETDAALSRPPPRISGASSSKDQPNQLYSTAARRLSSPMYNLPGGGGVGIGTNSPFGTQFGCYANLLRDKVAQNVAHHRAEPAAQTAPPVAVTFTHPARRLARARICHGSCRSSGDATLDRSAQRAILDAAPFPPLPPQFTEDQADIELTLPIEALIMKQAFHGAAVSAAQLLGSGGLAGLLLWRSRPLSTSAPSPRRRAARHRDSRSPRLGRRAGLHGRVQPDPVDRRVRAPGIFKMVPQDHVPDHRPAAALRFHAAAACRASRAAAAASKAPPGGPADQRRRTLDDRLVRPAASCANYLAFGYTAVQNGVLVLRGWLFDLRRDTPPTRN